MLLLHDSFLLQLKNPFGLQYLGANPRPSSHYPRLQAFRVPRDHVNRAAPTARMRRSRSMAGGRARQGPTAPPKPLIRASVSVTASDPPRMPPHIAETGGNNKVFLYPLLEHQCNLLGPRGRHTTVAGNQTAEVSPSLEGGEPGTGSYQPEDKAKNQNPKT